MYIAKKDTSIGFNGSTINFKAGDKASKVIGEAFPHLFDVVGEVLIENSSKVEVSISDAETVEVADTGEVQEVQEAEVTPQFNKKGKKA